VRTVVLVIAVMLTVAGRVGAQQATAPGSAEPSGAPLELASPALRIPPFRLVPDPEVKRFGIVTILPPDMPGQFVRARIPVGELASRGARAVADARRRRAGRAAHEGVVRALDEYLTER
jgi:hypothetical protein